MKLKTLNDMGELKGKRVFVRVDFNVPLNQNGDVKDDKRIRLALPTIRYLLDHDVEKIILASHLGRPKNNEEYLKTNKVALKLSELMDASVDKIDDWGESGLPESQIIMLENIRFHPFEKSKNEEDRDVFGKQLASLADIFVNEAFSNSHRKHASMTSIPKFIPACAGFGVEKEVSAISNAISHPAHPLIAIIGGLKADKLLAVQHLIDKADFILMAGALAFNLRKMQGYNVGSSKVDDEGMSEMYDLVQTILKSNHVILPDDAVIADEFSESAHTKEVDIDSIDDGWMALDIGRKTREKYLSFIADAKTILWFGPIGVFEMKPFSDGTRIIGEAIASSDALSIVGGGDSASAVKKLGLLDKITLVSTGGGASLMMIEGEELPALKILQK